MHLHPAALWCCCLGAGGQKSFHQLDLRMGLMGVGGQIRRKGWIKNQSKWNGVWRRRTPCETVNHVAFKYGPRVHSFITFCLLCVTSHCLHNVYLWSCLSDCIFFSSSKRSTFQPCVQVTWKSGQLLVLSPHRSVAPCSVATTPALVFCPPSQAQQGLLMLLWPLTLSQWGRDSLCSFSPSNPHRTTLVHWRWIQGAAFGGADTAALFHHGPH